MFLLPCCGPFSVALKLFYRLQSKTHRYGSNLNQVHERTYLHNLQCSYFLVADRFRARLNYFADYNQRLIDMVPI